MRARVIDGLSSHSTVTRLVPLPLHVVRADDPAATGEGRTLRQNGSASALPYNETVIHSLELDHSFGPGRNRGVSSTALEVHKPNLVNSAYQKGFVYHTAPTLALEAKRPRCLHRGRLLKVVLH